MAIIPSNIKDSSIIPSLQNSLIRRGKVRDTYLLLESPEELLNVASDRISIFDFVLPALVPRKGEVLTALTHFWFNKVLTGMPNHLSNTDAKTNRVRQIHESFTDIDLRRTLAIKKLNMLPFELIFRAHIGGSVWSQYEESGTVAGVKLPPGMTKWQRLAEPIFTPSTKASKGHDLNVTQNEYYAQTGKAGLQAEKLARRAYKKAYEHAFNTGIVILDTKFEVGVDEDGQVVLADEVLTPDSSRFTSYDALIQALKDRRDPPFFDKEPVRNWGREIDTTFQFRRGINNLVPGDKNHEEFVSKLTLPQTVIEECSSRYLFIFHKLAGVSLDDYQKEYLS